MIKNMFLLFTGLIIYTYVGAQNTVELLKKATSYRVKWDYDNTFKYLNEAEQSYPGNLSLEYTHAVWLADFSRYNEAQQKFAALIKRRKDFSRKEFNSVIYNYALCWFNLDSVSKGFRILNAELADNKYSLYLLDLTAHLYFCADSMEQCRNYLLQSYEVDSTDNWVVYFLGETSHHLGDTAAQRKYWDKALKQEQQDKTVDYAPYIYCFTGKTKEAIKSMDGFQKRTNYNLRRASVYGILGMKKECIDLLKKYFSSRDISDYYYVSHSRDFASVRNEPEFLKLMEQIKPR